MNRTAPRRSIQRESYAQAFERRRAVAWSDYLETTREAPLHRYEELEAAAWERLQRRLSRIADRELLLAGATA